MEPVVKRWQPHIDLQRLCEAAQEDILAASDREVREAALASGLSVARTAMEVRDLIAAVIGEPDEPVRSWSRAEIAKRDEHLARQH
jgi:hypothetical protein